MLANPMDAVPWNQAISPVSMSQGGQVILGVNTNAAEAAILTKGAVAIIKEAIEIVKASGTGAAFGELSVLPDETATLCSFCDTVVRPDHLAVPLIFVATIPVRLSDGVWNADQVANRAQTAIGKTIDRSDEQPAESSGNLVYAGYPYDPYK